MARKEFGDYYLGLDIGTDSVGWAVTDTKYNILKFNGKAMWGSYLFDEGKTAEERRTHRCGRRRLQRRNQRISLLRELFDKEIMSIDPYFFARLDESSLVLKDRRCKQPNSVFNDLAFKDKDLYEKYPTIYHLRKDLIETHSKPDLRLVYLALHHILKYRGHFLFEGLSEEEMPDFDELFRNVMSSANDFGIVFNVSENISDIKKVLCDRSVSITDKKNSLSMLMDAKDTQQKEFINLMAGGKIKFRKLFPNLSEEDVKELDGITFKGNTYEENEEALASVIGDEEAIFISIAKTLYDYGVLSSILKGKQYISDAKVEEFEQHKRDLRLLKSIVKSMSPDGAKSELYKQIFKSNETNSYSAYSKMVKDLKDKDLKFGVSQEDFCKYVLEKLKHGGFDFERDKYAKEVYEKLQNCTFMPKQTSKDNSVLPNSVHMKELRAILKNMENFYPFLSEKDSNGLSVSDKIIQIGRFRIPYYVGPLGKGSKTSWAERRADGRILPWNLEEKIDIDKTSEHFINRLISRCSYLSDEKVVPKSSLLYSRYMLYNELNSISVNGQRIDPQLKMKIVKDLFESEYAKSKVTKKDIEKYITLQTGERDVVVTGIDDTVKATLTSERKLRAILGDLAGKHRLAEDLVRIITIYGDDRKRLRSKLKADYSEKFSGSQIEKLSALRFSDWGRLSEKFLKGITHNFPQDGELSIISALEQKNLNLMELLSDRFTYTKQIDELNRKHSEKKDGVLISYDAVDNLYCSPAVKHGIWCALSVIKDILKITGHEPKKVFIETTRQNTDEGRKESRKRKLMDLYKACKGPEYAELLRALETTDEPRLRSKKLYAYYLQAGRCMYCGKPIDLNDLGNHDLCDIDHIYPQSKIKDDSVTNTVLSCRLCNSNKTDTFPIKQEIQENMGQFWNMLRSQNFISQEKYRRLTRRDPFSEDELSSFIARQLVQTSQSVKAVAQILNEVFGDKSDIVYVKAENVSEFRHTIHAKDVPEYQYYIKCRNVNDFHHAKDAYLNIVVGNVFDVKFTKDPRNFIRCGEKYSMNTIYKFDVSRNGVDAWISGVNGTIAVVDKWMRRNNVLFTRKPYIVKGPLFDLQVVKKGKGQHPVKNGLSVEDYGGYNKVAGSYYALVEHTVAEKRIRTIESIPVMDVDFKEWSREDQNKYIEGRGLVDADVRIPCIRKGSTFEINGMRVFIASRTGNDIVYEPARELLLPYLYKDVNTQSCIKKINNFMEGLKVNPNVKAVDYELDGPALKVMYDLLLEKLSHDYCMLTSMRTQVAKMGSLMEKFQTASDENKAISINNFLHLFSCDAVQMNQTVIGGKAVMGRIKLSKNLKSYESILMVNCSSTGLFEKHVDMKMI